MKPVAPDKAHIMLSESQHGQGRKVKMWTMQALSRVGMMVVLTTVMIPTQYAASDSFVVTYDDLLETQQTLTITKNGVQIFTRACDESIATCTTTLNTSNPVPGAPLHDTWSFSEPVGSAESDRFSFSTGDARKSFGICFDSDSPGLTLGCFSGAAAHLVRESEAQPFLTLGTNTANTDSITFRIFSDTAEIPVPEPSTSLLFALSLAGVLGYSWRQRTKAA